MATVQVHNFRHGKKAFIRPKAHGFVNPDQVARMKRKLCPNDCGSCGSAGIDESYYYFVGTGNGCGYVRSFDS